MAYPRLYKTGYLNNWLAVRCPGRDYEDWPAKDIDNFLDPPPWPFDGPAIDSEGNEYPGRTCYQMRGWEETAGDWKTPDERQAINSDMILNVWVIAGGVQGGIAAWADQGDGGHPDLVNVGYSDASSTSIHLDTPYDDTRSFREQLLVWVPNHSPIGILEYLEAYKWFDTQ